MIHYSIVENILVNFWQKELLMDIQSIGNFQRRLLLFWFLMWLCLTFFSAYSSGWWWLISSNTSVEMKIVKRPQYCRFGFPLISHALSFCMKYKVLLILIVFFSTMGNETSNLYMCHTNNVCAVEKFGRTNKFQKFCDIFVHVWKLL